MKKRAAGFTLVEMLVVIGIFGLVIAGISQMFISMLRIHRQQSRIAETNIEGIIGLELLRQDLEKAGFGLPWHGTFSYSESSLNPYNLNQSTDAPKAIISANNVSSTNGILAHTDYLVIRASNVATNSASGKWAFLLEGGGSPPPWYLSSTATATSDNLRPDDRVIVISPGLPDSATARTLITDIADDALTKFSAVASWSAPVSGPETRLVYGVDTSGPLRMPFNRTDYFVMQPSSTDMPKRCAQQTGILYKAVVNQNGGGFSYMPLLDCVADMQVIFRYTDNTGNLTTIGTYNDISSFPDADSIRSQVREVRVFILAHEGQKDTAYRDPRAGNTIHVGDLGYGFDRDMTSIPYWRNYRWKIYTLVVRLDNLL